MIPGGAGLPRGDCLLAGYFCFDRSHDGSEICDASVDTTDYTLKQCTDTRPGPEETAIFSPALCLLSPISLSPGVRSALPRIAPQTSTDNMYKLCFWKQDRKFINMPVRHRFRSVAPSRGGRTTDEVAVCSGDGEGARHDGWAAVALPGTRRSTERRRRSRIRRVRRRIQRRTALGAGPERVRCWRMCGRSK